jgi:hypothetical protein
MANPRILGHLMLYSYESHLLYGNKIGVEAIQDAAQRYYEEKIASFFTRNQYNVSCRSTKDRRFFRLRNYSKISFTVREQYVKAIGEVVPETTQAIFMSHMNSMTCYRPWS